MLKRKKKNKIISKIYIKKKKIIKFQKLLEKVNFKFENKLSRKRNLSFKCFLIFDNIFFF